MVTDRLWTDPWVAALPKGHPLALERALELADLVREPLAVLAPDPSGMRERSSNTCQPSIHRSSSPSAPQRLSRS